MHEYKYEYEFDVPYLSPPPPMESGFVFSRLVSFRFVFFFFFSVNYFDIQYST